MIRIREALGTILAAVGVYYVGVALSMKGVPQSATWTVAIGLALAVIGFEARGAEKPAAGDGGGGQAPPGLRPSITKALSLMAIVVGAYLALVGLSRAGLAPVKLGPAPQSPLSSEAIAWHASYEQAVEQARREGKPMILDFYTVWCVYCKKLDKDVFSNRDVAAEAARFVAVKIDGDARKDLARKYNVVGYPTVILIGSDGSESARVQSYIKAQQFAELLRGVR